MFVIVPVRAMKLRSLLCLPVFYSAIFPLPAQTNNLPPHPRLLLNAAGVAELKQRITNSLWAKSSWNELKERADAALAQPIELPPRGGNWGHDYVCPAHGARLRQRKKIGAEQCDLLCPVGDHVLCGVAVLVTTDFDGNAMMAKHLDYAR